MKSNQTERDMLGSKSYEYSNFRCSKTHSSQDGVNASIDVKVREVIISVFGIIPTTALVPEGDREAVFKTWCGKSLVVNNYSTNHRPVDLGSLTAQQAIDFLNS